MNAKVREHAQRKRVRLWQVAERMGIHDSMLSKKLRHELPAKDTEAIIKIIDEIAGETMKEDENNA